MRKNFIRIAGAVLAGTLFLTGCSASPAGVGADSQAKTDTVGKSGQSVFPLTLKDDAGRTVVLEKKPERIAAISTTMLRSLYAVRGRSIAKSDAKGEESLPKEAESAESIGHMSNIDMEKLVSLQPDLVIAQVGIHEKLMPVLEASKIPVLILEIKSYEDTIEKLKLMGQITGNAANAENAIKAMEKKVADIVDKLPKTSKKVVILYTTSQNVSVKLDMSIAGNIAKILKLNNIASGLKAEKTGGENATFSMEKIVESDPDVILITSMVTSKEMAEERIKKDLESNPAWNNLRAVKEKKMYHLPQNLFLTNPGENYPAAIEYMAKLVYPEVYGNVAK